MMDRAMLLPLALALALAATFQPDASQGGAARGTDSGAAKRMIECVVAVVNQRPILLSELEFEARVALIGQGGIEAADAPSRALDLSPALDYLIGQLLAQAEAERLQVYAVADEEVQERLSAFAAALGSAAALERFLARHEVNEGYLAAILRRELRVERYLDGRARPASRPSEEAMRAWYSTHRAELGDRPFAEVKETVRLRLSRERYEEYVRKHLEDLQTRGEIRRLCPLPSRGGDAGEAEE